MSDIYRVYVAQWNYRSGYGAYSAGDRVELPESVAAAINNDSPGVLVLADSAEPEPVSAEPAPKRRNRKQEPVNLATETD